MMRFDRFTERAQDAIARSQEILQRYGHTQLDMEHLLLAMVEQPQGVISEVLTRLGVDIDVLTERLDEVLQSTRSSYRASASGQMPTQLFVTPRLNRLIYVAGEEAKRLGDEYVSTEHILLAILGVGGGAASILGDLGVDTDKAQTVIEEIRGGQKVTDPRAETRYRVLEKYGRDLTSLAEEGRLDPVVGRGDEIMRLMRILVRRTKNNPVLIGDAGVGKTAIVEGLAQKIVSDDVPENLIGKRIVELDLGSMVAGSRFRGEFEERLKACMDEIQRSKGEIILFIDELQNVVGAGAAQGAIDASNMMKPALARGELQCIGTATLDEYRNHVERDSALERRFAPLYVKEPSVEETIEMLRMLRARYEEHHCVEITDVALEAAARLSHRYVKERQLPDKAVDLMDEAAAKLRIDMYGLAPDLKEKKIRLRRLQSEEEEAGQQRDWERAASLRSQRVVLEGEYDEEVAAWRCEQGLDDVVDEEDVAQVVASWTGIPVSRMLETEAKKLLEMEERIHQRIVGQEEAVAAVSDAIRRARSGLRDPHRPIGSFIFLGATGVGKTELSKALAEFLFDDEDALVRVDMSEYQERHTVSRLVGAPPGYIGYGEGGQLTEAVRRRPYQVVLFDEIEKAHQDVWNALLQILDEGRMTDGQGRRVDFQNTVVIMTSNVGTSFTQRDGPLGFRAGDRTDERAVSDEKVREELKRTFRPEFLNRVDEIIVFHDLTLDHIREIVDFQMRDIRDRLSEHEISIELTDEARDWLADEGYDPKFGARPLRRTLQREVETPLSKKLLGGELEAGDSVLVDADSEKGVEFKMKGKKRKAKK